MVCARKPFLYLLRYYILSLMKTKNYMLTDLVTLPRQKCMMSNLIKIYRCWKVGVLLSQCLNKSLNKLDCGLPITLSNLCELLIFSELKHVQMHTPCRYRPVFILFKVSVHIWTSNSFRKFSFCGMRHLVGGMCMWVPVLRRRFVPGFGTVRGSVSYVEQYNGLSHLLY